MGLFTKGIIEAEKRGIVAKVGSPAAIAAANAKQQKELQDQEESINAINLELLNQARLDSKTMVADQLAMREAGWRKQQTQLNKLSLQQSLYKTKIGTVV